MDLVFKKVYIGEQDSSNLQLSFDSTTNVLSLVNEKNEVISSITLPIGKAIQDVYYDSSSKELIMEFINADAIRIPVVAESEIEPSLITDVSDEFVVNEGKLSISQISTSKVEGLDEALESAGKLETIQINGQDLTVENKKININLSSTEFEVNGNEISIGKISIAKLVDDEEAWLVLNGGGANNGKNRN